MAISPTLLAELIRVLNYPKLGLTADEIEAFVSDILSHAVTVSPSRTLDLITEDPDDNRVIECALEADAPWIVSGDRHLLELIEYEGVRVIDARKALMILDMDC